MDAEIQGLSNAEVLARRSQGQGNNVKIETSRSYGQILRENVFTFINNALFILGFALILLGRPMDALISVSVIMVNVLVSVVQEIRAKRTLDRIALLTRPKATVIREGREVMIDPAEIVLGDILLVRPGDQIVVDGAVVGSGRMEVDESLLTGESDLIPKQAGDEVFSGSFCVNGSALYEATQVGESSFANTLTAGARAFRRVLTPLQQQTNLVIRVLLLLTIYFQILLAFNTVINQIPLVESVKMSVVIAGLVPNGLFLAIAVAYAMGAVRIAGKGALIQQANAVESLSNVDVLCLDKTGTLTANNILFRAVKPVGMSEAEFRQALGDFAASVSTSNRTNEAILTACAGRKLAVGEEVPFSSERKWSGLVFDDVERRGAYILGAPEMMMPAVQGGEALAGQIQAWAEQGLRVLLLAHQPTAATLLGSQGEAELPDGMLPLGLVCLSDELRPEAQATLADFVRAGVRLKIISGDNPATVAALARQAGLSKDAGLVSGTELAEMDEVAFSKAVEEATIFGRITPQQKEEIVRALRGRGYYVAMIGDGVNDVLSLKQANLGIAMQSGSQATRSVADIVLLKDSFASLPYAVREGQRILNGMQDIFKLFLTRVFVVALLVLSLGVVGDFPFSPRHSSLLALLTVGVPTLALAAWARPGVVRRRNLIRWLMRFVLPPTLGMGILGMGVFLITLVTRFQGVEAVMQRQPFSDALLAAQTVLTGFTIICGLVLIPFVEPPSKFWVGGDRLSGDWKPTLLAGGLLGVYIVIMAVPFLSSMFDLVPLTWLEYLLIVIATVAWAVMVRWAWRTRVLDKFFYVNLDSGSMNKGK